MNGLDAIGILGCAIKGHDEAASFNYMHLEIYSVRS